MLSTDTKSNTEVPYSLIHAYRLQQKKEKKKSMTILQIPQQNLQKNKELGKMWLLNKLQMDSTHSVCLPPPLSAWRLHYVR